MQLIAIKNYPKKLSKEKQNGELYERKADDSKLDCKGNSLCTGEWLLMVRQSSSGADVECLGLVKS